MNTYEWNCRTVDVKVEVEDKKDVIFNVHWRLTGDDGTSQTTVIGTCLLDTSNLENFVDFDNVKHSEVVSWVEEKLGEEQVSQLKSNLDKQLDSLTNPVTKTKYIES